MSPTLSLRATLVAGLLLSSAPALADQVTGAIIYNGAKNDGAFNELGFIGSQRAKDEGLVKLRERVAANEAATLGALRTYAKAGIQYLLTLGFANTNAVKTVASEYPDTKFTIIDGYIPDMANVRSVLFAEEQSGFLSGYVAGLKTKSGTIGTIGGMDIPPVRKFMCGFAAGAELAKPDVKVLADYISTTPKGFRDKKGGQAIAQKMVDGGADVLFAPAGLGAEGAATVAKSSGIYVIMVDANKNGMMPGTVLTSALKRLDEAAFATWQAAASGTWQAGVVTMTAADKGVDWAVDQHNRPIVGDIEPQVNKVKSDLAQGTIQVGYSEAVQGCRDVY